MLTREDKEWIARAIACEISGERMAKLLAESEERVYTRIKGDRAG